jgi:spermidine/putrescine transport system substrate-binding protein
VNHRLTREELLRRAAFGAALASIPGFAAACGGSSSGNGGSDGGSSQKLADTLRFSNWPYYIDVNEKTKAHPTLDAFTKKTGVQVKYTEDINSNSEFFGKIQGQLSRGQSVNRDIIVLTDNEQYLSLMIEKGWAEKLDKDVIANITNLVPVQQHPGFDPNRDYTLPWQSGMTGIAYNPKLTKPILSIDQLLEDKSLKGQITVLNNFSDTLGLVMLANGDDPSKVTDASFKEALDRVKAASDSGQIRQFTGNEYTGPLSKGDLKACVAWSGDIIQLLPDNPNLKWNIPSAGGMIWTDNMLIPKGGDAYTASTYMNYVYTPAVAAKIAAYIQYVTPVKGTQAAMSKLDPSLAGNQLIFPTEQTLSKVHLIDPDALKNQSYNEQWQAVLGA